MRTLAIDQGTTATKAIVVEDGVVLSSASVEVGIHALPDGGVEQDPEEIWRSVVAAGRAALGDAGGSASAVGLANQGETVLAWDRQDGRPLTPAISWQDRRSREVTQRLAGDASRLRGITGLPLDPYFAAPKMRWLRERVNDAGIITTIDAWINQRLTGRLVTDATTASRTMLLDLDRLEWSADALAVFFGSDAETLPDIVRCDEVVGDTDAFGPTTPLAGLAVDQQAALLADGCLARGDTKCTFGTGAFLLVNTGPAPVRSDSGLAASVAWQLRDGSAYCLDGQVYTAGSAIGWLRDIGVLAHEHDLDRLASAVPSTGEVIFVPGLAGLAAPFCRPDARGAFLGLSLSTSRAHLARAVVDGIAASVAGLVWVAEQDLALRLDRLVVDGGLTRSSTLMQAQADLAQVRIEVHPRAHATALGVAALTLMAMDQADAAHHLTTGWRPSAVFEPQMSRDEAAARLDAWQRAAATVIEPPAVAT